MVLVIMKTITVTLDVGTPATGSAEFQVKRVTAPFSRYRIEELHWMGSLPVAARGGVLLLTIRNGGGIYFDEQIWPKPVQPPDEVWGIKYIESTVTSAVDTLPVHSRILAQNEAISLVFLLIQGTLYLPANQPLLSTVHLDCVEV